MSEPEVPPLRLRRAESVLARRTGRVLVVLEQPWNDDNVVAVLRTVESFGVQNVWTVSHPHGRRRVRRAVTKGSHDWLTLREFEDVEQLLVALEEGGWTIWASDLSTEAEELRSHEAMCPVPERVALILGREVDGVSRALLEAAERRFYLPMVGFTESFNLTVASGMLLQRLFDADPGLVGAMGEEERRRVREAWYPRLGGRDERKRSRYLTYLDDPPPPLDDPRPPDEHRVPRVKKRAAWRRED